MTLSTLTTRDDMLLRLAAAGKSAREMGEEVGIPAAQALLRVKEILGERDIWSEVERRAMLMDDLYALKDRIQVQLKDVQWLDDKQILALTKVIQTLDESLEKNGSIQDDLINRVSEAQAAAMLRLIENGFKRAAKLLQDKYPTLEMSELKASFQQGLLEAQESTL